MAESSSGVRTQGQQIITQDVPNTLSTNAILKLINDHRNYVTTMSPPNKPLNGSIILYDKKVQTKVQTNFRDDGYEWKRGVQEQHQPRKKKGVVVLHCYVAIGKANENFQRRIYWMKEEELNSHIALVHYLETERKEKTRGRTKQAKKYLLNKKREAIQKGAKRCAKGVVLGEGGRKIASNYEKGSTSAHLQPVHGKPLSAASFQDDRFRYIHGNFDEDQRCDNMRVDGLWGIGENPVGHLPSPLQVDDPIATSLQTFGDQSEGDESGFVDPQSVILRVQVDLTFDDSFGNNDDIDFNGMFPDSAPPSDTGEPKNATDAGSDTIMAESSAGSNDMICSVKDFSPDWAYQNNGTKVLICGTFSNSNQQGENCQWYCVFGEDEVRAEHVMENVLSCITPKKKAAGIVPFYVKNSTGSVRSAEVKEFKFLVNGDQDNDCSICRNKMSQLIGSHGLLRLSSSPPTINPSPERKASQLKSEIVEILKDTIDQLGDKQGLAPNYEYTDEGTEEWYKKKEERLTDNVLEWLFQKVDAGGEGLSVLDESGHGVLHHADTLGSDRILEPTVTARLQVDFPDVNDWAAYCGRKTTVGTLLYLGAVVVALTSKGRTPAELASQEHHNLAKFLLERADISQVSHPKLESKQDHCAGDMEMLQVETQDSDKYVLDGEEKSDDHSHYTDSMQPLATSKERRAFRRWVLSLKRSL